MKQQKRLWRRTLLGLLAAAALTADSRWHLQVCRYFLNFSTLPEALDGYRIVLLSDLHGARFGRGNERLARLTLAQRPDLIVLCGDFADSPEEISSTEELLRLLQGEAPIAWVSGNHDWAGGALPGLRRLFDRFGVLRMENRYLSLPWNGSQLILAGVEDPNGPADMPRPDELAAQLRRDYPEDFVLWLAHRNDYLEKYPALPVDLVLCGHAHGGLVRLPLLGGLFGTDRRLGARYESGVYAGERYPMLVSRGLGNASPLPRFFNRPEIAVIILHSGQSARIQ
ncbi:MAG: metallophosphoesterase [Oscillospiraceae bacterium]|nr:metallophosphoesterase [Oscillospiraceae bacterium]